MPRQCDKECLARHFTTCMLDVRDRDRVHWGRGECGLSHLLCWVWCVCVEIRIICASWFFPSVMWVLEMELGELGLAASTATTH